jgi:hypothetical protein
MQRVPLHLGNNGTGGARPGAGLYSLTGSGGGGGANGGGGATANDDPGTTCHICGGDDDRDNLLLCNGGAVQVEFSETHSLKVPAFNPCHSL